MLPIQKCREILGECGTKMTDEQIEQVRGSLYGLADMLINKYIQEVSEKQKTGYTPETVEVQSRLAPAKRHSRKHPIGLF